MQLTFPLLETPLFKDRNPGHRDTADGGTWQKRVRTDETDIVRYGYRLVGGTLCVFLVWSVVFPISSAVVAPGTLISNGRNQVLQHPAGGVVEEITASNGSFLKKGDVILRIDTTPAKSELAKHESRRALLVAQKLRYTKMRDVETSANNIGSFALRGVSTPLQEDGPQVLVDNGPEILTEQMAAFDAEFRQLESEISALKNREAGLRDEVLSLENQKSVKSQKVSLLEEEIERTAPLVKQGYISRTRHNDRKASLFEEKSRVLEVEARVSTLKAQIAETRDRLSTLISERRAENAEELSSVLAELAAVNEQINVAEAALNQTTIRSPVDGTLVDLATNTVGGVIEPGEPIGEVVPSEGGIIVEARVNPTNIGDVKPGQTTKIVISALQHVHPDPLAGVVTYVAADSRTDELTGQPYVEVHVELDTVEDTPIPIRPGMLSEVYVNTGSRSLFAYLVQPLTESFSSAFRER
ncbi:HlyD family type I secretion periplasmic adaptor subunit [Roseibium sp.]|uniref:HlyD family type I secretion periplasmic adaptor subunit n=1 Tax=Roseibium sp. TaxID=1936156 RepID=UPI003BB1A773